MRGFTGGTTPIVILDGPGCERVYSDPVALIRVDSGEQLAGAFAAIERALANGHHAAGYLAYELGYTLEKRLLPLLPAVRHLPLLWFGVFKSCQPLPAEAHTQFPRTHAGPLAHEWDDEMHCAAFRRVHELISAGDLYQANISYRARFAFVGDPFAFYRRLKARSGAHHCAYIDDGERQILSLSPELFFARDPQGGVKVRPMKGTAERGATAEADATAVARLRASEKERAENLMIVDLMRNDLSKITCAGSVRVDRLFEVETYPTLHQMVSTVSAQLASQCSVESIVHALFPCGSVTGAPKLRAMEIIRDVETSPRGVYCGAIGHFAPDGAASFNVAIRTLTITNGRGELGLGSAVVHDSRALAEYEECRLKAQFFETVRQPVRLIETLRHAPSEGFVRSGRHLARMASSAAALGFVFDSQRAQGALDAAVRGRHGSTRVRLLLDADGAFEAEAEPLSDPVSVLRYTISLRRVDSRDPLLRHKTDRRGFYDHERDRLAAATGCDEVLFLNEKDQLTEASRSNIFIERDGWLVTPHIDCGLLDGCLRRELLDRARCSEAHLSPADLEKADRVFLGNSLRGLIPALAM